MSFVTLTSQGQISIPAKLRRELKLKKQQKLSIRKDGEKIILESPVDIFKMAGSLKHKAMKGKSIDEIIELEHKAIEKGVVEDYLAKLKRIK